MVWYGKTSGPYPGQVQISRSLLQGQGHILINGQTVGSLRKKCIQYRGNLQFVPCHYKEDNRGFPSRLANRLTNTS